ncbi:D-tyrosyl-tRNA(Tyr) deacylase [Mycoemilia scoparia]|uniref:D-aminoacyl-tRNA deacylase n=1 Tax=Mycoemilia scoparia TaxID=417184 RepID=A0A9W7ZXV3_9FUNG|nr:D-tyrosyl-tRNA(Tyr) deacylase [Mycoemilia scoparia]
MRVVLQKVANASVTVGDRVVGKIGKGVCVLIGIYKDDTVKDMDYMIKKILGMRVFEDDSGKMWTKSVKDLGLEVLCVSQFTLYGKTNKGNKPDFHDSMRSEQSRDFYNEFVVKLRSQYDASKIQEGEFGAMMLVNIANDGPVTLELDSRKFTYNDQIKTQSNESSSSSSTPVPATQP